MVKHGHARRGQRSKTYHTWTAMMRRCTDPAFHKFPGYGARGIKVCFRWHQFENFLADMGEKPRGKTIERVNNDGDYCKENCRWATNQEQSNNRKSNRRITFNGVTKNMIQWAHDLGISKQSMYKRLKRWPIERALTQWKTLSL